MNTVVVKETLNHLYFTIKEIGQLLHHETTCTSIADDNNITHMEVINEQAMDEIELETVKTVDASTQYECPIQKKQRHIATQTLKPRLSYTRRHKETHQIFKTAVSQEEMNSFAHLDHNYNVPMPAHLSSQSLSHPALINDNNPEPECETDKTVTNDTLSSHDEHSSTSEDDSGDEYICSNSEESSNSDSESEITDNNNCTFIVYECQLDELFKFCKQCGSPVCEVSKNHTGSMVTIKTQCLQNHTYTWNSQPITEKKVPAGNLMIPAAILFTGGTFQEFSSFAQTLKLNFISKSSFYNTQDNVLFPILNKAYKEQQLSVIDEVKNSGPANLCGDGRSDSPGHNAKYGTYSLMNEESGKILDFSIVHVSEVSSSYAMEYEGCKRSLDNLLNYLTIRCLTTDRHVQITAQLQKSYPNIKHQYDVWHLSKSVTKKLTQKAKTKGNEDLKPWIRSISNHLWWTVQTWREGETQMSCRHQKLTRKERKQTIWLKPGSNAHVALEEVICNKRILKDIRKLTEFHHTGNLEVFHSLLLKYAPKRKHFSYQGMVCRTQLAILDHNNNCNRSQAITTKGERKGEARYKVVFPKNRKAWVAKPILECKSYNFVTKMMDEVIVYHEAGSKEAMPIAPAHIPRNIATVPRPPKEEVVKQHISRKNSK